jgi:uncharacterized membrane protein YedE/YeeE
MEWMEMSRWSPYVVGAGIGLLSCLTFLLSDKPIGCSTAFARTGGMVERIFRGGKVSRRPYFQKFAPVLDWEWMLVAGVVVGAAVSAGLSGDLAASWVPARWAGAFGPSAGARLAVAVLGGVLMGMGSRWAGGCTSGHGISGTLQLAASSWLAVVCFFAAGVAAAMIMFRALKESKPC